MQKVAILNDAIKLESQKNGLMGFVTISASDKVADLNLSPGVDVTAVVNGVISLRPVKTDFKNPVTNPLTGVPAVGVQIRSLPIEYKGKKFFASINPEKWAEIESIEAEQLPSVGDNVNCRVREYTNKKGELTQFFEVITFNGEVIPESTEVAEAEIAG